MIKLIVLFISFSFTNLAFAQSFDHQVRVDLFSEKLSQSLNELKNSVDQLSRSNEDLALKNSQFKTRLNSLQATFDKLGEENQNLNSSKLKLQESNPSKLKQITELEKSSLDMDYKNKELKGQLKSLEDQIASYRKEDQDLSSQFRQMANPLTGIDSSENISPENTQLLEQKQKEKLAVLKMITESQMNQKLLHEKIFDTQKSIPLSREKKVQGSSQKTMLESQIQQLQLENNRLQVLSKGGAKQGWDDSQILDLEKNIRGLEKNRDELNDLLVKMQQRAQRIPLTKDQKNEQGKLQSNINGLKKESKNLKFDLQDLQQQMVDLDKRKTYLENLLKN